MRENLIRLILGSESDWKTANIILDVLHQLGIYAGVSIASCHWHTGDGLEEFILGIKEELIVYVGGMQFAAPGIAETINKIHGMAHKIILVVPTDKVAMHANQDLPFGTVVFLSGFNSIDPEAGYKNCALAIAKLIAWKYPEYRPALQSYLDEKRETKPLVPEEKLIDGLIPDPETKKF